MNGNMVVYKLIHVEKAVKFEGLGYVSPIINVKILVLISACKLRLEQTGTNISVSGD